MDELIPGESPYIRSLINDFVLVLYHRRNKATRAAFPTGYYWTNSLTEADIEDIINSLETIMGNDEAYPGENDDLALYLVQLAHQATQTVLSETPPPVE